MSHLPIPRVTPRRIALGLGLAALLAAGGCGGGSVPMPDDGSEDGLKIAQLVSEFNDAKADARRFAKIFAGQPTAGRGEYDKYSYNVVVGSPRVNGDAATASVTVHKESDNEVVATKDWTFTKVGDEWKIATAPVK